MRGGGGGELQVRRCFLRVVLVDVDVVQRGLLQAQHVDHGAVQDVVGLCEELVEAPTLLLVGLQDVGENWSQEALKTPERPGGQRHVQHVINTRLDLLDPLAYLDRLQDTGISELHSIFPFSDF